MRQESNLHTELALRSKRSVSTIPPLKLGTLSQSRTEKSYRTVGFKPTVFAISPIELEVLTGVEPVFAGLQSATLPFGQSTWRVYSGSNRGHEV